MREANKAIIRERHIIPKLEDILTELSGATYFTKLDLTEGCHQIEQKEEQPKTSATTYSSRATL